jgi:hypothetical protein
LIEGVNLPCNAKSTPESNSSALFFKYGGKLNRIDAILSILKPPSFCDQDFGGHELTFTNNRESIHALKPYDPLGKGSAKKWRTLFRVPATRFIPKIFCEKGSV